MPRVRALLLLLLGPVVAVAIGMSLLLTIYVPSHGAAARLGQLLSRSFGMEIDVGRIEVPLSWREPGTIILHDVGVFEPRTHTTFLLARSAKVRLDLLPLIQRELKFRWIEVERPEFRFEGTNSMPCDAAFAYLNRALEGWADLASEAHRVAVDRLTLRRGAVSTASVRLTDVELDARGWGSPTHQVEVSGQFTLSGSAFPFQAAAQVSALAKPSSPDSPTPEGAHSDRSPVHMAAWMRIERAWLAPLQPLVPQLDLQATRASGLLNLGFSPGGPVVGAFEARADDLFMQGGKEPWDPNFRARFEVKPAEGTASILEAIFSAPGVQAKGTGEVGCAKDRVRYRIRAKDLVMNLAELRESLPWLREAVAGRVVVEDVEAKGVSLDRSPQLKLAGRLEDIGPFALWGMPLMSLDGHWQATRDLDRLRARAALEASSDGGKLKAEGMITLTLQDELLKIPEFALTLGDHAQILLSGTLPLETKPGHVRTLKFVLPTTKTAVLQEAISGLLPEVLVATHLSGALEATLNLSENRLHGEVRLEDVGVEGELMTLRGGSGRIPLMGRLDVPSKLLGEAWPGLSEEVYEQALQDFRQRASAPSLVIASMSYTGLALQDLRVQFSPHEDALAIDHLTFRCLGGIGWARGVVDLFGGSLHLAVLLEGLSLRELSHQFPSIQGYISGKVNGMLEFLLPLFEPSRATGRARFWSVDSEEEPREISRALLERLGAQAGTIVNLLALWGDRPYDHGLLEVTLKDRTLTFHRLELSNTTLLVRDLDIKVVPPYNKIAIQELLETMQETWKRVQQ